MGMKGRRIGGNGGKGNEGEEDGADREMGTKGGGRVCWKIEGTHP